MSVIFSFWSVVLVLKNNKNHLKPPPQREGKMSDDESLYAHDCDICERRRERKQRKISNKFEPIADAICDSICKEYNPKEEALLAEIREIRERFRCDLQQVMRRRARLQEEYVQKQSRAFSDHSKELFNWVVDECNGFDYYTPIFHLPEGMGRPHRFTADVYNWDREISPIFEAFDEVFPDTTP
jgi:hypothetical protein